MHAMIMGPHNEFKNDVQEFLKAYKSEISKAKGKENTKVVANKA